MTHLDHDHRERENVRLLAVCPLLGQDLWRSPSCGMTLIIQDNSHGIQAMSDRSQTEIGDPRMTSLVHEDIWLLGCQSSGTKGLRKMTYAHYAAVDDVLRMEKSESLSNIGYLMGVNVR